MKRTLPPPSGAEKERIGSMKKTAMEEGCFLKVKGDRPYGVAFDSKGTLYMVTAPNSGNGTLWKVTPDGKATEFAKLEGTFSGSADLDKSFISSGMDIDEKGNIYITLGDKLLKILPDGKVTTLAEGFKRCFDVKADRQGNLFVADDKAGAIYKFIPSMEKSLFYQGSNPGPFVLTSLVFDKEYKNLYAREGTKILKFNAASGKTSEKPEVVVDNLRAFDICMDDIGNIYASTAGGTVKKINTHGRVTDLGAPGLIKTSIGLNIGKGDFGTKWLYVADTGGIVRIPLEK